MRVWIDLANSPHPPLFAPITRRLEQDGHDVLLTARDHAQTAELARAIWPSVDIIGRESPGGRMDKARALVGRTRALRAWAKATQPDVALSHNSYAQIVAAGSLGIPQITAMDYEHQPANHLAFRLAKTVLLPEAFPARAARRQGAASRKVRRYPGLKESLYLGDFQPSKGALKSLKSIAPDRRALVLVRTPPSRAIYHRAENRLFVDCLRAITTRGEGVATVILARHAEQRAELAALKLPGCAIPEQAVDARSLLYEADLFLGAGGTMTREAALMRIPTVSIFAAAPAAVDDWLERRGMIRRIASPEELLPVEPRPHPPADIEQLAKGAEPTLRRFITAVEEIGRPSLSSPRVG